MFDSPFCLITDEVIHKIRDHDIGSSTLIYRIKKNPWYEQTATENLTFRQVLTHLLPMHPFSTP